MRSLELFLHDKLVGVVEPDQNDRSRVSLDIDRNYNGAAVLLTESFATIAGRRPPVPEVSNFLGGYVPEGNHRDAMAAKRRIDKDDLFALLREFGGSIAGAVTLRAPDEPQPYTPSFSPLSERELTAKLNLALQDSDQGILADSRSTLPGYQPKVLVAQFDGQWVYPHGRAHSTHILKPQVPARPSRLFDEHYSHLLTQHVGLSNYKSEIRTAGPVTYLAIERFDREVRGTQVHLHHQEDLAQALGLDWRNTDTKFQDSNWPTSPRRASVRRMAELFGSIPKGDAVVDQWLRHLTFHVAIGNNDAHAKNVALIHGDDGTSLAPIYDALPNLFQDGLISWDLALAVNGVFDHRRLSVERLVDEATSWRVIAASRASTLIGETLRSMEAALGSVTPPKGVSEAMVDRVHWNVERLLAGAEISEPKR